MSENSAPNFSYQQDLELVAASLPLPLGGESIDREDAKILAERLAKIARKGYPLGMRRCAYIFELNSPSSYLFKFY